MNSGIYQIVGPSGKVYIGQSQDIPKRLYRHQRYLKRNEHTNAHLQNAWNKYGSDAFHFEPLAYFPIEDLDAAEQVALDSLPADRKYNIAIDAKAPTRGLKASTATREKLSRARLGNLNGLGYKHTPEAKEKIRQAMSGRKVGAETRAKLSLAKTGNTYMLGKKMSEDAKAKISAAHLGKKSSEESKNKNRLAHLGNNNCLGRKASPEARENMRQARLAYLEKTKRQM